MVRRGEIRWYRFDRPNKRQPVLVLTRDSLIAGMGEVVVAPITTAIRGLPCEVRLGPEEGMPKECVVNLVHVEKLLRGDLGNFIGKLPDHRWADVRRALLFALGFEP